MADMTYAELAGSTYDELSAKTYAFTADETSGDDGTGGDDTGGSSSVSCLWTETRIAAIETRLSEVLSKMDTLAKPEDVKVTVNADGIDLSEVTGLLEKIFALIARWKISGNTLTAYASNGSVIGTFNVTRDADGIITEVHE